MVTKRQIKNLKSKLNINDVELPGVFLKGKDGKIRNLDGEIVSDEELKNNKSPLPDVVLVRGKADGY